MIAFRNLALRRGGRLLLSGVDASLHAGWKVGVVGRNGSGKSSLFAAIRGELDLDAGSVDLPAKTRIASVLQETPALPDAAIDYVLGGDSDAAAAVLAAEAAEAAGDHLAAAAAHQRIEALAAYDARARAGRLLHGLGFAASVQQQPVASFSGGWRVRLNLARALMAPSDLLLLDEPTNHLDLDAVLWLEQWLRRYPGMLLVISHTLHLEQGGAKLYVGNYSAFERQRSEQLQQQQIAHDKEQVERVHLQSFIDRFGAKASKARQAQSRMKRLQKLAGTEAVRAERPFHFSFPQPDRVPLSMLKLVDVEAGYESGTRQTTILNNVRLGIEAGDRIGLLGANGAGKSTLVKTLVGDLPVLAGERTAHRDLAIGYFAQHTVEGLKAGSSPFQHLRDMAPQASAQELRDWLGRWQFAGDRAYDDVENFSGGERARLALALIAWSKPNLLVLDEPTNHLDLDMREALAEALNDFEGALVLVAHDRHLLGLVCDSFWHVADGRVQPFDGDLDDYAAWLRQRDSQSGESNGSSRQTSAPGSARERRRDSAAQREQLKKLRQRLRKVESEVERIDTQLGEIDQHMSRPETWQQTTAELADLGRRQAQLRVDKEGLEGQWLELSEAIEEAGA